MVNRAFLGVVAFGNLDRLLWAPLHRLFDLGPLVFFGCVGEQVQEIIVADFEDLRCDLHADRIALTQVVVDDNFETHGVSPR